MRTTKSQETIEADTELLWNKIACHDNFFGACERMGHSLTTVVEYLELFAQLYPYGSVQKAVDTFERNKIGTLRLIIELVDFKRRTRWE